MLNQEEKKNLKRPITKEFEVKIKILLRGKKKSPGTSGFTAELHQTFTDLQLIFPKIFLKNRKGRSTSTFFCKASITLIPKVNTHKKCYKPITLMNVC